VRLCVLLSVHNDHNLPWGEGGGRGGGYSHYINEEEINMQGLGSEASQAYNVNNMPQAWGPYIFFFNIFSLLCSKKKEAEKDFPPFSLTLIPS
jgi:hypothetical protein